MLYFLNAVDKFENVAAFYLINVAALLHLPSVIGDSFPPRLQQEESSFPFASKEIILHGFKAPHSDKSCNCVNNNYSMGPFQASYLLCFSLNSKHEYGRDVHGIVLYDDM